MVEILYIVDVLRGTVKGETKPLKAVCENAAGDQIEVSVKAAAHVPGGVKALAVEWTLANLAGDLGLPVCAPHLVKLDAAGLAGFHDQAWVQKALAGNPIAFGSQYAGSQDRQGFGEWTVGYEPKGPWLNQAWHTAAFDAWTDNIDRSPKNANCLVRGEEFRIIDHEKCFTTLAGIPMIGIKAKRQWETGGAANVINAQNHIFFRCLKGKILPRQSIKDAWLGLPKDLSSVYGGDLPSDWADAVPVIHAIARAVADIQANIDGCLDELERCLT